jgi:RNA polymerase sigma-70 factor (ECF subfamily)
VGGTPRHRRAYTIRCRSTFFTQMPSLVPIDRGWKTPLEKMATEPRAFEEIFEAERDRLLKTFTVITGNRAEAEDIVQDAFLKIWERWDSVRAMDDPVAYLNRTAINCFHSRTRRALVALKRMTGNTPAPDAFELADDRHVVARALPSLTPRQRAALIVTEVWGYKTEEAGKLLGVKASTVRALAFQGRAALKTREESLDA